MYSWCTVRRVKSQKQRYRSLRQGCMILPDLLHDMSRNTAAWPIQNSCMTRTKQLHDLLKKATEQMHDSNRTAVVYNIRTTRLEQLHNWCRTAALPIKNSCMACSERMHDHWPIQNSCMTKIQYRTATWPVMNRYMTQTEQLLDWFRITAWTFENNSMTRLEQLRDTFRTF